MKKIVFILLSVIAFVAGAQTKVVAHRGYWNTPGSAQNSITSLIKADSIGAFGSELDVWLTKDNRLVVNHDKVFKGVDMPESTYQEIRNIRLDNGEVLPSLEEYLAAAQQLPKIVLVLEVKSAGNAERDILAVQKITEMLKKYNVLNRTDIISFSLPACKEAMICMPSNDVYYLNGELAPAQIKELGMAGIDYSGYPGGPMIKHPEWIDQSHQLGLKVNVWTIDSPEAIKGFKDAGVEFITTNNPEAALEICK